MNWIKENKFLTGFFAITLIGAGVLGFLMMTAMTRASTAQQNYDTAAAELTRLQNSTPYPDEANRAKMEELKKQHKESIDELQKNLVASQIPLNPATTQVQFQDKLKEAVTRLKGEAGGNVKLPDKFYMSFDRYETETPKAEAAAPLLRMLESMELVVKMLIDNNVAEITGIKHDPLPEEAGKKESGKDAGKGGAKDEGGGVKGLVVRHPMEVTFVAREGNFHKFINNLVTEKKQFFIPKSLVIKNENDGKPPSRSAPAKGGDEKPAGEDATMVVGEEKLEVTVKIDVVDFAGAPTAKAEK